MNRFLEKYLRIATLVIIFSFALSLVASPAFSRDRWHHSPRNHRGSHHGRADVLPALIVTGIVAGIAFSLIDSAANRPVREYRLYTPVAPPNPCAPMVRSGSVMVTAQLLNVRTGPSLNAPLMLQLPYGAVLSVSDSSPGWYYVNLPGNRCGWVMAQFTEPMGNSGEG